MTNKQKLINHVDTKGKDRSWFELAKLYNIKPEGTPSQRTKAANDIVRNSKKKQNNTSYTGSAKITPKVEIHSEYEEFLKWKAMKDAKTPKNEKGIHIVLSCLHVPFHNKELLNNLLEFIKDYKDKIKGFHLIGDFLDLASLSFHDKGKVTIGGLTLGKEYKEGNKVLDLILKELPTDIRLTFIYGNHEDRYFRHVSDFENSKYSDALTSPTEALKLKERGFEVYENWRESFVQLGKLQLIHGIFCTATPAKTHLNRLKESVMFGHTHRLDTYYEGDKGAFNIGTMADIDSEAFNYISRIQRMSWKNAFGLVHLDDNGFYQADVVNCVNNHFWYGGKKY